MPACAVETTLDNPDDFYPPGSIRREEAGEVVIEFSVDDGTTKARDVSLVRSSGYPDLDDAALRLGRALQVNNLCGAQRVRRAVAFTYWADPTRKRRRVGCVVFNVGVANVLVVPVEEP